VNGHGDANGAEDIETLSKLFEEALIVHRGKPSLESKRPNPYSGDNLPDDLQKYLIRHESFYAKPVDEDKLPEFFERVLQQWGRSGLVRVAGPQVECLKYQTRLLDY
jgi:hypothetical protein